MAIKLGGGGGSASQIDEIVFLNNTADTVTLADGRVYLKGGVIETNLSTYPLADSNYKPTSNFSVAAQDTNPNGITWDGTYYWVVGQTTYRVYKYNAAGVYQSVSFSVSAQETNLKDIVWDGTYFWVIGSASDAVYKYNAAGVYQSVTWSVSAQTSNPYGITWDGTYFWVSDVSGNIYKYNSAGVYQSVTFSTYTEDSANGKGITWDGTHLWTVGTTNDKAYQYNTSGVYQNESFSVVPLTNPEGIVWNSAISGFAAVGRGTDSVSIFQPANGITSDTSFGGQNYVRVK